MRTRDRFLARLYERTGGRIDRTVHAYLHIAIPLGLPLADMERCINDLVALGLVEVDPGFHRLVRLTPLGIAACEGIAADTVVPDIREMIVEWHGFVVPREMHADLAAAIPDRAAD